MAAETLALSIGKVAAAAAGHADIAAVRERLRDLVDAGLIEPLKNPGSGPGFRKLFEPSAAYVASVLQTLAELRLPVGRSVLAELAAFEAGRAAALWLKDDNRPPEMWLSTADRGPDRLGGRSRYSVSMYEKKDDVLQAGADVSIVLNLARLFRVVDQRLAALAAAKTAGRGIRRLPVAKSTKRKRAAA